MKVLYLTFEDVILHGVLQNMVVEVAELVGQTRNVQTDIVSFRRRDENLNVYNANKQRNLHNSVNIIEHKKFGAEKSRGVVSLFNLLPFYIIYSIKCLKYDVIHVRSYAFIPLLIVAKLLKKKCVWDPRGILSLEIQDIDGSTSFTSKILSSIEWVGIVNCHVLICVSFKMKEYFESLHNCCTVVIPNPTNFKKYKIQYPEKNGFVYVGRLLKWHMPEALRVFAEACFIRKEKLTIITPDKEIAKQYFGDRVEILSLTPDETKQILPSFKFAYCIIKPTKSKLYCAPVKFAEYIASELLIIANKQIGDIETYIEKSNNGRIVDDFTVSQFLSVLDSLRTNNFNKSYLDEQYDLNCYIDKIFQLYGGRV